MERLAQIPDAAEVPAHQVVFSNPRSSRYAVLIPVINEGDRILRQLGGMAESRYGYDIVIADGGSTDGSMDVARLKDAFHVSALLVKTGPGRQAAQLRMGFLFALQCNYEGVITIDGNGKDDHSAIPRFAKALDDGFDFVQGSRYAPGGAAINTPWDRALAVKCLHAPIIRAASGFAYTDTTNGFRGMSRRLLLDERVRPLRAVFDGYNLNFYLSIRAAKVGLRVCEIPVRRSYPQGAAPTKIGAFSGRLEILKETILAANGAYDP